MFEQSENMSFAPVEGLRVLVSRGLSRRPNEVRSPSEARTRRSLDESGTEERELRSFTFVQRPPA